MELSTGFDLCLDNPTLINSLMIGQCLNYTTSLSNVTIGLNRTNLGTVTLNNSFEEYDILEGKDHTKGITITDTPLRKVARYMDYYFVPCIIAAGLIGNTLSFMVFVLTRLRRLSSSVYLAALSISDSGFLICVFFSWSNNVNITVYHKPGWCQAFVYMTYLFGFLSVWYIVAFSCERFIAVKWPFKRSEMCTPRRARIVVISLAVFALITYSFAIWTSEVTLWYGMIFCVPKEKYRDLVEKINNIDSVITLVVPFVTILFFNSWIVYSVRNLVSHRQQQLWQFQNSKTCSGTSIDRRNASRTQSTSSNRSCTPVTAINQQYVQLKSIHSISSISQGTSQKINLIRTKSSSQRHLSGSSKQMHDSRKQYQLHVTKMLLTVSSIFLLLNLPSHIIRLYDFFHRMTVGSSITNLTIVRLQKIFTYIYYVNFAINFLLYNLCGKNFRKALKTLIIKMKSNIIKLSSRKQFRRPSVKSIRSARSFIMTNV